MPRRKSAATTAPEAKVETPASTPAPAPAETPTIITGRLCADPSLRHTRTSGKPVTTTRIAVNTPGADAAFHTVVVWGRTAEVVCQYLKKGRMVQVEGRTQERTFTAQDGTERRAVEIVARRVEFVSAQAAAPTAGTEAA